MIVPSRSKSGEPSGSHRAWATVKGHWLKGCLAELKARPLETYRRGWRECGDYARLRVVPGYSVYLLSHPDAVEHVLVRNHGNYRKPALITGPIGELAGKGLVTSEGDLWQRQRKLAQPTFRRERIAGLGMLISQAVEGLLGEWERFRPGQQIDILAEMMKLTLTITGTTLFGTDLSDEAGPLGGAFRTAFAHVRRRMNALPFEPRWLPTAENRRFAAAKGLLDRVVREMIEIRRCEGGRDSDLLAMLLDARDEAGQGMPDRQLIDEVLTLLTAGHDTVGAALSWAWYLLGRHPDVQGDLGDELRGALGGRTPTPDDLPDLPLTRAVFAETLRLFPPAPALAREAIAEDEIGGHLIPRRGLVMVSQHVTHRHPEFWPEPDRFLPERFLPGGSEGRPKFAYFPFGGGPRSCIGNHFALMEGTLILAAIAQRYRVNLVPGQTVEPDTTFTLRPRPGVEVALWPRAIARKNPLAC